MKNKACIKLVTWNINGLRAILQREKSDLNSFLQKLDADILCFQETKLARSELDEELVRPIGTRRKNYVTF
jgi:exonuclease III